MLLSVSVVLLQFAIQNWVRIPPEDLADACRLFLQRQRRHNSITIKYRFSILCVDKLLALLSLKPTSHK